MTGVRHLHRLVQTTKGLCCGGSSSGSSQGPKPAAPPAERVSVAGSTGLLHYGCVSAEISTLSYRRRTNVLENTPDLSVCK